MNDTPSDFDLKFLPDWLKEPPAKNAYADYEGDASERADRPYSKSGRDRRRENKPGGERRRDQRDSRPPRKQPREQQVRGQDRPQSHAPAPRTPETPVPVKVEFLPEEHCAAALAKQIKSSARAYPLFDLARMFLEKPERHNVKITATEPSILLHQCGNKGPVSLDRQSVERVAFSRLKSQYFEEETVQKEPLKGNFGNVARCRLSGTLLGPTNYHAYQPTLRRLYEERFSRRMSFPEYQRQIEIVTEPSAIEAWKEQSRTVVTYKTLKETEPLTFESSADAEQHFREKYVAQAIQALSSCEVSGEASRQLPDRGISAAVRHAWQDENRFPGQLMNHLRREFIHAGLYIFKHRNRVQLVSAIRPTPFNNVQQTLSKTVSDILKVIQETPKCTRANLVSKIQEAHPDEDSAKVKTELAADFHWLVQAGHVIELFNGILELPEISAPSHGKKQEPKKAHPAAPKQQIGQQPVADPAPPPAPVEDPISSTPEPEEQTPVEASAIPVETAAPEPEPSESAEPQALPAENDLAPNPPPV